MHLHDRLDPVGPVRRRKTSVSRHDRPLDVLRSELNALEFWVSAQIDVRLGLVADILEPLELGTKLFDFIIGII